MLEVILRPRVDQDLIEIARYTKKEWGEPKAKRYLQDIREQIDFAAEFPSIGSEVAEMPAGYRKVRSGSHRIIYRCNERQLIVLRVLHERQDVPDEIEDL